MRKIVFIVNPVSGVKKRFDLQRLLNTHSTLAQCDTVIATTSRPHHAFEIATKAVQQSIDMVVAVGGDGTVREVAEALVGSQTVLGIIPAGSGNGLARHLGIPLNPAKALALLAGPYVHTIDTGRLGGHFFLNVAGFGFDGLIAERFATSTIRGFWVYAWLVLKEYLRYRPATYRFVLGNDVFSATAFLVSLANSSQWGNGAAIAPQAQIDDGRIDVALLQPFPWWAAPAVALRLFAGSIHKSRYFHSFRCRALRIETEGGFIHADGEALAVTTPCAVAIDPASLKVAVPQKG